MQNVHIQGHVDETLVLFFFCIYGTWAYLANNSYYYYYYFFTGTIYCIQMKNEMKWTPL